MHITTRGKYGVKAMFELTMRYGEGPIPLKRIAENQDLPEHYLEQLVAPLRKAELVRSVRGAQGGYMLARDPREVTVGEILRVLEGPLAPVDGSVDDSHGHQFASPGEACPVRGIWIKIRDAVETVVNDITLEDLRLEEWEKRNQSNYTYYI